MVNAGGGAGGRHAPLRLHARTCECCECAMCVVSARARLPRRALTLGCSNSCTQRRQRPHPWERHCVCVALPVAGLGARL